MHKYRGIYRVCYETDKRTGKPQEFTFLPCRLKRGTNVCRHDDNTLNVYIPSAIITRRLLKDFPYLFTLLSMGDGEGILIFLESALSKATGILKPTIQGRNISPRSKRNKKFI